MPLRQRDQDVQPALARRLGNAGEPEPLEHPLEHPGDLDGLLDGLALGRIEIEHHPVRLGQALRARVPGVDLQDGVLR